MSILSFSNVGQRFGAFDVFMDLSGSIPGDGKIGLVGPNGIGKTTLLLILAGLEPPTAGGVHLAQGRRLGYLPQEAMSAFAGRENTVHGEMLTAFATLRAQEAKLRVMEEAMAAGQADDALIANYGKAQEAFEQAGGYTYEGQIKYVLLGLGFTPDQWETPLSHLSGGQKTRALLARLILERPDLLILDEPTNHLDISAVEWLEGVLRSWEGALLIVSHDRYFLDRVVNAIWELSRTGIEVYRGNYSAYATQRAERWEQREKAFEARKERLEKELEFVRRNLAGQNTGIAKGKLRRLRREFVMRGQSLQVDRIADQVKGMRMDSHEWEAMNLRLESTKQSGELVLRTYDLRVGYDAPLFRSDDIVLLREECAALIGPNGAGKTTFLRTILGQMQPLDGEVRLGASLKVGYFAQAHEGLRADNSVLDELLRHKNLALGEARNHLAQYLFRQDDVFKQVKALSGGERARLALAILALQGANFLVLDEPTNHLDIPAQEVLETVLANFDGTILMVSHDRYLVDKLATQIWEVRDGRLLVFDGDYQEYLEARTAAAAAAEVASETRSRTSTTSADTRQRDREARKRAEALAAAEAAVERLEQRLAEVSQALEHASAAQDVAKVERLGREYAQTETALEAAMAQWETLAAD